MSINKVGRSALMLNGVSLTLEIGHNVPRDAIFMLTAIFMVLVLFGWGDLALNLGGLSTT